MTQSDSGPGPSDEMTRRAFIATMAGVVLAAPGAVEAQAGKAMPRIGVLSPAGAAAGLPNLQALRVGLRELGYIEGQNIAIEVRWADGRTDRLDQLAAELARLPVRVICTAGTQSSEAAKRSTSTIPIVFANVAFPDRTGLVASYARPGGNITGVAFIGPEYGKRLELLKEARPGLARVGLIYNPENHGSVLALEETRRWAEKLGVRLDAYGFRGPNDFDSIFGSIAGNRPDGLMTTADPLIHSYRARIADFALKLRLPSMYPAREFVDSGGLLFYGGSIPEMYRRAAVYVDRILKGARPADLPVEQPTKLELVINLKTAQAIGLTLPPAVLARADRYIE